MRRVIHTHRDGTSRGDARSKTNYMHESQQAKKELIRMVLYLDGIQVRECQSNALLIRKNTFLHNQYIDRFGDMRQLFPKEKKGW